MLIEDYLTAGSRMTWDVRGDSIPVRFGPARLAEHLSDSAIATALVEDSRFRADLRETGFSIGDFIEGDLADHVLMTGPEETLEPVGAAEAKWATEDLRSTHASSPAIKGSESEKYTFWGTIKGFLVGAGVTAGALVLLSLVT
jgi:hypothetical protein